MLIALKGTTLGYNDRGRGERPLLLLHAFPLDRRMWQRVAPRLERTARLVTFDLRGLGESDGDGQPSIDGFADDAAALLDALGIRRAVVGGLSMGGYAALAFARRHPERLAGLLLADTRAAADTPEGRAARDVAIARIAGEGVGPFCEEFVGKLVAPSNGAAKDHALAIALSQTPVGVAGALGALRDRPDATAHLASIAVPTTVIVGALDAVTPPSDARLLARAIPGATLVEIPGSGHLAALEAPEAFADAAEALLERARL